MEATSESGVNKSFKKTIEEVRADGKLTKEELETVMTKYEKEKQAILAKNEKKEVDELHQVNALLVESFDDMFEEYEVKGKEDLDRIQRILDVVNPMRLATDKMGVIINAEVTDFYKDGANAKITKNIKLDNNGQLRFQKFYEGFFTRDGVAAVKTSPETLSESDIKKLAKMMTANNNMLRGSNPDYIGYMNEALDHAPALSKLAGISSSSVGDLHLGQLETINGKVRISDIDDAFKSGSPTADIVRMIASIRASAKDTTEADANVKAFLDTLQAGLKGEKLMNLTVTPDKFKAKQSPETQEALLTGGFVKADKNGTMSNDIMKNGITRITDAEKTSLSKLLGKSVIDGRHDVSDGIGSAGKDKILVTVQDNKEIKIYEFKEQDKTHAYATFFSSHPNPERADVAKSLGVDIQSVTIDGKPYTQKEIVPGYEGFDPTKSDANGRKWASEQIALQLAGLYQKDGKGADILTELQKTDVQEALKKVGTDYATRITTAMKQAESAYPEVKADNEKKDTVKALGKKVKEVEDALNANSPNLQTLQKLLTELTELITKAQEKKVDQKDIATANNQLTALNQKITELTPIAVEKPKVTNNEKFEKQIKTLEEFFKKNPNLNDFMEKVRKDDTVANALGDILQIQRESNGGYLYNNIRKAIKETQNKLGFSADGAFGPLTLKAWQDSDKYGKKVE